MGYGNGFYVSYITLIYYSEKGLAQANANDKKITEFFQNVKIWLRENDLKRDLKFTEADKALDQLLQSTKKTVHDSFCDNFNIPSALVALFELIKKTYDYANQAKDKLKIHLIYSVAHFLQACDNYNKKQLMQLNQTMLHKRQSLLSILKSK